MADPIRDSRPDEPRPPGSRPPQRRVDTGNPAIWGWVIAIVVLIALGWIVYEVVDTDTPYAEPEVVESEPALEEAQPAGGPLEGEAGEGVPPDRQEEMPGTPRYD